MLIAGKMELIGGEAFPLTVCWGTIPQALWHSLPSLGEGISIVAVEMLTSS